MSYAIVKNGKPKKIAGLQKAETAEEIIYKDTNVGEALDELNSDIKNLITVKGFSVSDLTIPANGIANIGSPNIKVDGYTPIGIVRYALSGTSYQNIVVNRLNINGNNADVYLKNIGSTSLTISFSFTVIYAKSTASLN